MQVAMATAFGGPEVLVAQEMPDPVAGPGEVVIEVAAVDVLWVETLIRRGAGPTHFAVTPPYVPGNGVAGRVRAIGEGVDPGWIGRAVVGHTGTRFGGYAERVAISADALSPVPDGLGLHEAAALVHDPVTALALFEAADVDGDDRVLVVGASGGLGIMSIQLARARGARVVAVARGTRKLARIQELGPDALIDAEAPDWVAHARAALGGGADVILDNVGGDLGESAFAAIAAGGRFSAHGMPSGRFAAIDAAEAERLGVTTRGIPPLADADRKRLTEQALAEAAAGRIAPVIGQTFPLARAAAAHAAIENRTVFGKTLLVTDAS